MLILSLMTKPLEELNESSLVPKDKIKEILLENALRLIIVSTSVLVLGILISSGIVLTITNLTSQFDQGRNIIFSGAVAGSLGLVVGSMLVLALGIYYINKVSKKGYRIKKTKENKPLISDNLEKAIILLIQDFIEERHYRRQNARQSEQPQPIKDFPEGYERH